MTKVKEIWKDIPNYEGLYQASNLGRIKRLSRIVKRNGISHICKEIIRRPVSHRSGYDNIVLFKDGKRKNFMVHQLIAITFLNHSICGHKIVVNHKDWNKTNNCVSNLELVTNRQNSNHKRVCGTSKYAGVHWSKDKKKWTSRIRVNGKNIFLGYFNDEITAHQSYQSYLMKVS